MRASALRRRDVQRREDDPPGVGVDPGQEARVGPFARSPDQGIDPNVEHLAGRQLDRARQTTDETAVAGAQRELRRPLDGRRQGVAPDDSGGERRRERVAVAVGRAERQRLPRSRLMAT